MTISYEHFIRLRRCIYRYEDAKVEMEKKENIKKAQESLRYLIENGNINYLNLLTDSEKARLRGMLKDTQEGKIL